MEEEKADPGIFTMVADAMVVAFACADFSAYQGRLIWRIIGGTWGQHGPNKITPKTMAWDPAAVAKETGGKIQHIRRAFELLVEAKVLIYNPVSKQVGVNIRIGEWEKSLRRGTGFKIGSSVRNGLGEPKRTVRNGSNVQNGRSETDIMSKTASKTDQSMSKTDQSMSKTDQESSVETSNARAQMIETGDRRLYEGPKNQGGGDQHPDAHYKGRREDYWSQALKAKLVTYNQKTVKCPDDGVDLGTLPDGKPDTPSNRARLGNWHIEPMNHPGFKGLGFQAGNKLTEQHGVSEAWLEGMRENIEADIRQESQDHIIKTQGVKVNQPSKPAAPVDPKAPAMYIPAEPSEPVEYHEDVNPEPDPEAPAPVDPYQMPKPTSLEDLSDWLKD